MYTSMLQCIIEQSPCFLLSLFSIPFCSPFVSLYLLGTLLAVIGSVHLVPRLLVNWSSLFLPLLIYPSFQNPDPPGFSRSKYTFIRTTSRTYLTRSSTSLMYDVYWLALRWWRDRNTWNTIQDQNWIFFQWTMKVESNKINKWNKVALKMNKD